MSKDQLVDILRDDYKYEVVFDDATDIPIVIFRASMTDEDISIIEGIVHDAGYTGSWGTRRVVKGQLFRDVIHELEGDGE